MRHKIRVQNHYGKRARLHKHRFWYISLPLDDIRPTIHQIHQS